VAAGDLFVALSAARDGHDFVADALEKGAVAALVSRNPEGVDPARLLIVPDVLEGLADLGRAARARTGAKVVAVTGSVGKTTVKEMLRADARGAGPHPCRRGELQQPLGRAGDAGADAHRHRLRHHRDRHERPR
jgi:UDP-N-acetylmuramyl tripeptide synthase